ncbi:MAG: S1C family serine protease [bacterium]
MQNNSKTTFLFLSIFFGFLAGALAVFLLGEYQFNNWYLERAVLDVDDGSSNIVIQSQGKVEVVQDLRIKEVFAQIKPSVVSLYRKKTAGKDIISQVYQKDNFAGYGIILTSDGWLASAGGALKELTADEVVVVYDHQVKGVLKKIFDRATDTFLLKIDGVDLPVIKFGSVNNSSTGEQLLAINTDEIKLTNLSNISYVDSDELLRSSEKYYEHFLLSLGNLAAGSAVINFQGDFIGMVVENYFGQNFIRAVPIDFLQRTVNLVLRESKINYPYLGIHFLDISSSVGLNQQATKGLASGALLYGRGSERAINSDSPLSGLLLEGDVITKVGNYEIGDKYNLSEFVLNSKKGDVVEIEYVRDAGKRGVVKAELK